MLLIRRTCNSEVCIAAWCRSAEFGQHVLHEQHSAVPVQNSGASAVSARSRLARSRPLESRCQATGPCSSRPLFCESHHSPLPCQAPAPSPFHLLHLATQCDDITLQPRIATSVDELNLMDQPRWTASLIVLSICQRPALVPECQQMVPGRRSLEDNGREATLQSVLRRECLSGAELGAEVGAGDAAAVSVAAAPAVPTVCAAGQHGRIHAAGCRGVLDQPALLPQGGATGTSHLAITPKSNLIRILALLNDATDVEAG